MQKNPLSTRAVKSAVIKNTLQHPIVLYPSVTGILAAVTGVMFNFGSLPFLISAGGAVTAIGGWLFEYFARQNKHSMAYIAEITEDLNREREQKIARLSSELENVQCIEGVKQLELLKGKYRNFEEILATKLAPTEMTYSRYLGIAEQVYLAILDNLDKVYLALKSVSAVDPEHLAARLQILEHNRSEQADEERKTLGKRLELRQEQLDRATGFILANERALTELDHVTAKIASVQMNKGRADLDLEMAMEELRRLADRADQYTR